MLSRGSDTPISDISYDNEMTDSVRSLSARNSIRYLNMTSADFRRKQREQRLVDEERNRIKANKEIKKRQKEEEKKRDMEMLMSYNPWGKPGGGAPALAGDDNGKAKPLMFNGNADEEDEEENNFVFGRPGAGAPNRTKSGRIRAQFCSDPELKIRLNNSMRYKNPDYEQYKKDLDDMVEMKRAAKENEKLMEKQRNEEMENTYPFGRQRNNSNYSLSGRRQSDENEDVEGYNPWGRGFGNPQRDDRGQVKGRGGAINPAIGVIPDGTDMENYGVTIPFWERRGGAGAPNYTPSGNIRNRMRLSTAYSTQDENEDEGYNPWGKPGAGAPQGKVGGQKFMERMGWSMSGNAEKRSPEAKQTYLNELQQDMDARKIRREQERQELKSVGNELASVMREKEVGQPKRDPVTGEIMAQPKRTSDVTSHKLDIRRAKGNDNEDYISSLSQQAEQRQKQKEMQKEQDRKEMQQHIDTWDGFWGRPGNGAPRDTNKRGNLNLNTVMGDPYSKTYMQDVSPSNTRTMFEYNPTRNTQVKQKEYIFRTPFASM